MDCLSEDVLNSHFSEESEVWVVLDANDMGRYLYFPKNETTLALFGFMKKGDAEQLAHLIKELAPDYKDITLTTAADVLKEIRAGAKENHVPVCIWTPNDALEFFERYPELLGKYYGVE